MNLPAWVGFSFMPGNDLVIPMYERLQQSGIIVFEVDWRYHIQGAAKVLSVSFPAFAAKLLDVSSQNFAWC